MARTYRKLQSTLDNKKETFRSVSTRKATLKKDLITAFHNRKQPYRNYNSNVNKDNTIRYQSNRYSVPVGTYTECPKVILQIHKEKLIIIEPTTGEIIAKHRMSSEKGKLIKNTNHSRDRIKSMHRDSLSMKFVSDIDVISETN